MKQPHLEDGYTRINNHTLESLARVRLTSAEFNIVLTIIRKTWGFNKKSDSISISQLTKYTDLSRSTVIRVISSLVEKNMVVKKKNPKGNEYTFNKYAESWICKWNSNKGVSRMTRVKDDTRGGVTYDTHKRNIYKDNIDISNDISKGMGWEYFWESFCTIMEVQENTSKEVSFIRMLYNSYADVIDDAMIELCEQQLKGKIKNINHARGFLRYKCKKLAEKKKSHAIIQKPVDEMEGVKVLYEKPEPLERPECNLFAEHISKQGDLPN